MISVEVVLPVRGSSPCLVFFEMVPGFHTISHSYILVISFCLCVNHAVGSFQFLNTATTLNTQRMASHGLKTLPIIPSGKSLQKSIFINPSFKQADSGIDDLSHTKILVSRNHHSPPFLRLVFAPLGSALQVHDSQGRHQVMLTNSTNHQGSKAIHKSRRKLQGSK